MSGTASKRAIQERKAPAKRPELDFEPPHVFRVKSEHSLAHLRESQQFLPCAACSTEGHRREEHAVRPQSSYIRRRPASPAVGSRPSTAVKNRPLLPPTPADIERLSRPKSVPPARNSENCNWPNFVRHRSKYAIKTPYGFCNPIDGQEHAETRPPFVNYGGRYDDKQFGEKRTFNSLAIHQLKHHEVEEQRLADVVRERRLRLQAENYFREMEERKARAQEVRDRAARSTTEYRDNYRPPIDYEASGTFARH